MSHFSRAWTSAGAIVSVLLTGCSSSDSQGQKVEQTELPANLPPDVRQAAEKVQGLGSPSSPWGFAEVEKKLAAVDTVVFCTVGRAELAAAAALPRASDVTTLLGAATVRAQSTEMETVGVAPGERT
jgi:hypothetical protein